mgnify:CR=1 FL=1
MALDGFPSARTKVARLVDLVLRLASDEWRLAKAEVSENLGHARLGATLLACAFGLGLVAVFVLSGAAVAGLAAAGLELWLSALIVGGALALMAAILIAIGVSNLKAKRLVPDRTLSNIQRDMEMVKEALNA